MHLIEFAFPAVRGVISTDVFLIFADLLKVNEKVSHG